MFPPGIIMVAYPEVAGNLCRQLPLTRMFAWWAAGISALIEGISRQTPGFCPKQFPGIQDPGQAHPKKYAPPSSRTDQFHKILPSALSKEGPHAAKCVQPIEKVEPLWHIEVAIKHLITRGNFWHILHIFCGLLRYL